MVYPLVPEEITAFCSGKAAVLVLEEGQPEFIEQDIATMLRRAVEQPGMEHLAQTKLHGKDVLIMAGEYTAEVIVHGLARFLAAHAAHLDISAGTRWHEAVDAARARAAANCSARRCRRGRRISASAVPSVRCSPRSNWSSATSASAHISADIGCHSFATFAPFSLGNSILGYGMSLASSAGVAPMLAGRSMAIMGDGGFWHNGFLSGVASNLLNGGDAVLLIMKNGYTSATGTQDLVSSPHDETRSWRRRRARCAPSARSRTRCAAPA